MLNDFNKLNHFNSKLIFSSKENLLLQLVIVKEVFTTDSPPHPLIEIVVFFDQYVNNNVIYETCGACD